MIEERLDEIAHHMTVHGPYRARVLAELRAHLEDATERYEAEGLPHDGAVQRAIDHLGSSEVVTAGLRPQQTRRTRILAALPLAGIACGGASARAANILHEHGDRLWSSPLYTSVWLIGWLSIILLCGSVVALFVRHRGRLGRGGAVAAGAATVSAGTLLAFHFANDGSLQFGDAGAWRTVAIVSGLLVVAALVPTTSRAQVVPTWPLLLAALGLLLIGTHYLALDAGGLAQAGFGLLAVAAAGLTAVLLGQRSLA